MLATDFTRDDCQLGQRRISYNQLCREYRCNDCGGRIIIKPPIGEAEWYPACGICGNHDFIHEVMYQKQRGDAQEVLAELPQELREQLRR